MEEIIALLKKHEIEVTLQNVAVATYFMARKGESSEENQLGIGTQKAINANISPDEQRQIDLATEQFKQSVQRVDNQILALYVQAVQNGDYAEAERILENAIASQQTNTLMFALLTIGVILLPLYAKQRLINLFLQFGLKAVFVKTKNAEESLRLQAVRGARSHVQTIAKDIKKSLDEAIDSELPSVRQGVEERFPELVGAEPKNYLMAVRDDKAIYEYARQLILSGASRDTIIKKIQENFTEVSRRRASLIARNESNRVFTMSQYEADEQFLAQNELTDTAYKRLVSNTGRPEAICKYIIEKTAINPIPFKEDFAPFGKTMSFQADGKKYNFKPNYEKLRSGHIHVNCNCRYELLLKQADGTFFNTYDGKALNDLDFDEKKHKRDTDGKFSKKATTGSVDFSKLGDRKDFDAFIEEKYFDGSLGIYGEDQTDAVRAYQGNMYDAINIHARAQTLDDPLVVFDKETTYGETIDNINLAANITFAGNGEVYRGTEIPYHQTYNEGETINALSFMSTSADSGIAEKFKYKGGSLLVVSVKKGQKAILPDLVTFGTRGKTMGEAEVLMPSGSTLKITKIDGDVVYAELL